MTVENREKLKYALAYHGLQPPSSKENLSEVENLYFQLISWGQQVCNFDFIGLDKVHVSLIFTDCNGYGISSQKWHHSWRPCDEEHSTFLRFSSKTLRFWSFWKIANGQTIH